MNLKHLHHAWHIVDVQYMCAVVFVTIVGPVNQKRCHGQIYLMLFPRLIEVRQRIGGIFT